jgi:hypothetical protein
VMPLLVVSESMLTMLVLSRTSCRAFMALKTSVPAMASDGVAMARRNVFRLVPSVRMVFPFLSVKFIGHGVRGA